MCTLIDGAWVCCETGRARGRWHRRWFESLDAWRVYFAGRAARHCGGPLVFCEKCQAIHEEPACDTKRLPSSE